MNSINSIPVISIRHNAIVVYNSPIHTGGGRRKPQTQLQLDNQVNLTRGDYNGYMSFKTKSKVVKMLNIWINGVTNYNQQLKKALKTDNLYVTFVTLTLCADQKHSDSEIKRSLSRFIDDLKRLFKVNYYFWRAEPQENGRIHFHLIIDKYIEKDSIKALWDEYLDKLGYLSTYREIHGSKNEYSPACQIHRLESVKDAVQYLVKYCCKVPKDDEIGSEGYRKIKGRIWGCSDELRMLTPYAEMVDTPHAELLSHLDKDETIKKHTEENFVTYRARAIRPYLARYSKQILNAFNDYQKKIILQLYVTGFDLPDPSQIVLPYDSLPVLPPPVLEPLFVQTTCPF